MIEVLEVLPGLGVCGGVENYLMNYYRHTDRDRVRFSFAAHQAGGSSFAQEIRERGDSVFVLPPFTLGNLSRIREEIGRIFSENRFDIVHCHQANAAYFYFTEAKKHGIRHRILHSHQAAAADRPAHRLRNYPLLWLAKRSATDFVACSRLAGDWLYRKRPYFVIRNAIETERFAFDPAVRDAVRAECGIPEGALVIGHIGRFSPQKNQAFLLGVLREVLREDPTARLLFVGGGEQYEEVRVAADEAGLSSCVIFTGVRTDTARLYQAMDVFAMPSLYEGLPVVGVEAQAAGLPVFFSDAVTHEAAILSSARFLPLRAGADLWAKEILSFEKTPREGCAARVADAGYEILREAPRLTAFYETLCF